MRLEECRHCHKLAPVAALHLCESAPKQGLITKAEQRAMDKIAALHFELEASPIECRCASCVARGINQVSKRKEEPRTL